MTEANKHAKPWWRRGSSVLLMAAAAAAALTLGGAISAQAQAQAQAQSEGHESRHEPPQRHDMAPAGPGMMFNGAPEQINRAVDQLLDGLAVSNAQRSQIRQIALTTAAELKLQRDSQTGLRDTALQVFAAPVIDAAAAESLRQQMLVQHDQLSKRTLQAMLDVARVLTPEQRVKAAAQMKQRQAAIHERRERMGRDHGERAKQ